MAGLSRGRFFNRRFPDNAASLAEVNYHGSSGIGLFNNWNINVSAAECSRRLRYAGPHTPRVNFRPYPQFGTINHYSNHNSCHGVTFRLEKRFLDGVSLTSFYTRSKSIDDANDDGASSRGNYPSAGARSG